EVFDRDALLLDEILDELVRGRFGLGWLPAIGGLLRSRLPAGVGFAGVCGAVGVTGGVRLGERQEWQQTKECEEHPAPFRSGIPPGNKKAPCREAEGLAPCARVRGRGRGIAAWPTIRLGTSLPDY